jgi:hypothetical protein
MRIKLGALITEASGKLGGCVIQKGNSSLVMRTQLAKRKIVTTWLQQSRCRSAIVTASWRSLSQVNRNLWLKEIRYDISGYALFVRLNSNLLQIGLPLLSQPMPPVVMPIQDIWLVISNTLFSWFEIYTRLTLSLDFVQILMASPPLPRNFKGSYARVTAIRQTNYSDYTYYMPWSLYSAKYGSIRYNHADCAFKVKFVNKITGQSVDTNTYILKNPNV